MIGKPGVGKSTMAKKLAQEWKAELVNRNLDLFYIRFILKMLKV